MFLQILALAFLAIRGIEAYWPDAPYFDQCSGTVKQQCTGSCQWFEKNSPWCYDKKFESKYPPVGLHPPSDFVKKFFVFSFGTHLAEGSNSQIYYNYNVTECAVACLQSPGTPAGDRAPGGARCLSFDFYPFEAPENGAPFFETLEQGVCVLNTGNKDSARLRNEDQGLTDAELFYRFSHFTKRPSSNLDGYYEIRDVRGSGLAKMLDYQGGESGELFGLSYIWGQARWGIAHTAVPPPIDTEYRCQGAISDSDVAELPNTPLFNGGFTPVDIAQHCPGKMSKSDARALCQASGGSLCPTQASLLLLNGKKLGCSLDGEVLWAEEDAENVAPKFVRCCAQYGLVDSCDKYTTAIINKCAGFKQSHDCVNKGSGISRQLAEGFGNLLIKYRNACQSGRGPCKGLVEPWFPRDDCVYCLEPGNSGKGQCRPGNSYGICQTAKSDAKAIFGLLIKSTCGPDTICRLVNRFPDLGTILNVPTKAPTNAPSGVPTTSIPTKSPTAPTSTKSPTLPPVKCGLILVKARCESYAGRCVWTAKKCKLVSSG